MSAPGDPPPPSNLRTFFQPIMSTNPLSSITIKNRLDEFVTQGGDINKQTGDDNDTYLMIYLDTGKHNISTAIAEHPSTDVNIKNNYEATALHKAVETGWLSIVNILISRGANVNAKNDDGNTPLHLAASHDAPIFRSIIKSLLIAGADKSLQNNDDFTPYNMAEIHNSGNDSVLNLLRFEGGATLENVARGWGSNNNSNGNSKSNSINLLNTIERRRNPYPTKTKDRYFVIKEPIDVYDFGEVDTVKVTYQDTLADRENIYFKASNPANL